MPAASLGHYASLSFVVIGRGQWEDCGLRNGGRVPNRSMRSRE